LKVEHSAEKFAEGRSVILTLKDSNILDDEDEDTLVNVNIVDDERATKKIDDARKAKVGYNAYDQEDVDDMTGEVRKKNMLAKYDEEIDGAQKSSFRIGDSGEYSEEAQLQRERDRVRQKLAAKRTMESLQTAQPRIASDYYTHEEVLQFKKPKKKKEKKVKSTRKSMLKADDLLAMDGTNPLPDSFGSRSRSKAKTEETPSASNRGALPMDVDEEDGFSVKIEHGAQNVKVEPLEDDNVDFQDVLKRAKKLRARRGAAADLADQLLAESKTLNIKKEADDHEDTSGSAFIATFDDDAEAQSRIILNETAEFCRNLGARSLSSGDEFWRSSAPGPSGYGAAESGAGAEVSR
jgi:U4/U6.U5 tri-snRNP-associated protein 1